MSARDPSCLSPKERLAEVASLLAIAYRRLKLASETRAQSRPHNPQDRRHDANAPTIA